MKTMKILGVVSMAMVGMSVYAADIVSGDPAGKIDLVGVKKVAVSVADGMCVADLTVTFQNGGAEAIRLEDGVVTVVATTKDGKIRKQGAAKTTVTVGPDGKETKQTVYDIIEENCVPTKLCNGTIGTGENAITFNASTTFDRVIRMEIGRVESPVTTEQLATLATIMGDPKTPYVLKVDIKSGAAKSIGDKWVSQPGQVFKVEATITPSTDKDFLMKK